MAVALGLILPWQLKPFNGPFHVACGLLAMLGPVWLRRAYWVVLAGLVVVSVTVCYTPLAPALLQALVEDDGAVPADVIVVLSGSTTTTTFRVSSETRFLRGLELLHAGLAPVIVFTGDPPQPGNQFHVMAPAEMERIGLSTAAVVPFQAVETPLMNTFTEAQSIRKMAADHGWRRVLLVTSASHTRRAAATFRAVGFEVTVVPAATTQYDLAEPASVGDRLTIFRDWVYETNATLYYRLRGRL